MIIARRAMLACYHEMSGCKKGGYGAAEKPIAQKNSHLKQTGYCCDFCRDETFSTAQLFPIYANSYSYICIIDLKAKRSALCINIDGFGVASKHLQPHMHIGAYSNLLQSPVIGALFWRANTHYFVSTQHGKRFYGTVLMFFY